ncbi:MAG: ATP-binding protein [Acidobacteria bacterium]|nr:ATP-binding protein [Acidobacteriota bacterium]
MSKDLRFRRLRLRNWKNFLRVEVAVRDRLFLVGANAAGKSNFLDAFRFLRDIALSGSGFREAVLDPRRGGVSGIRCLAARRYPDVEIAVELEEEGEEISWKYEIAFHQDNQRRPRIRRERVSRGGKALVDRPNKEDAADPERLTQTYLEQVSVNQVFRDLAVFFGSIRYLHLVPQLVREPDRSVGRTNDPFGGDFLEQVAKTQERTRTARLGRIQRALRVAVPQLEQIDLWRDARGTPHLRGKYQHWRAQGAWQSEEQFSDGTLRLMGLLWAVMDKGGPLLLEEPELSLHPEIVRVLPQMLARVQRLSGRQVFVSTHSPDLLRDDGIGLDEAMLLVPGPEGTDVVPAGSSQEVRDLLEGGLSLADIAIPKTRPENAAQLALFGDA